MDLLMKKLIKIGGQFSGVGAFDFALKRLEIEFENVYQAEWDKYARETYKLNHGTPKFYTKDVYDTPLDKIPELDIAMFSPPCQSFSMAGGRKGEDDDRGVLFYNSHNFIKVNRPRFFIFENVKGLLSDDGGRTFQKWTDYLGGKTVNGNVMLFPHDEAVPYHIYWSVLNAKNYGIPQNRERVFIIGIRDDKDNVFEFPKPEPLKKTLKDCLEENVDEKYFIDAKQIEALLSSDFMQEQKRIQTKEYSDTLLARDYKSPKCVIVKSNTKKGYEVLEVVEDSLNLDQPNSETRRGRVGKKIAQTITTSCNQAVFVIKQERTDEGKEKRSKSMKEKGVDTGNFKDKQIVFKEQSFSDTRISPTITTMGGGNTEPKVLTEERVRKLTPRECFRLMDFPDIFMDKIILNNNINSQGIVLSLSKKILCENVQLKTAIENQKQKDCVLCTIREKENTETKILFSNTNTEKIKNAKLKIAVDVFSQLDFANNTIIQTEDMEILYLWKKEEKMLSKKTLKRGGDYVKTELLNTDLLFRITLEESWKKENASIILTVIPTIMKLITYIFSNHKGNTIKVIISYKKLQENYTKEGLLVLKKENIILSDSQLYKQAGNSICVGVLCKIIERFML